MTDREGVYRAHQPRNNIPILSVYPIRLSELWGKEGLYHGDGERRVVVTGRANHERRGEG
jgi:hypothetical protein